MRFTKQEVLDVFDREDRSYRLALLASNWIRNAAPYTPSAAEEARGTSMQAGGKWIFFTDLTEALDDPAKREAVSSEFVLNQLHALIRSPFEVLRDYCEDFGEELSAELQATKWYWFARIVRNAISHNFRYNFDKRTRKRLPLTWNGITLTQDLHGKSIAYGTFWHRPGYELFLEMRRFAESLPERP